MLSLSPSNAPPPPPTHTHTHFLQGVKLAMQAAEAAYAQQGAADCLQLFVEAGVEHTCTEGMWRQAFAFLDRHLLPT